MQAADAGGGDGRGVGGSDGRQRWTADGIAEGGKAQAGRVEMVAAAGVAAMVAAERKRSGNGGNGCSV
jgi:hypothetical protein